MPSLKFFLIILPDTENELIDIKKNLTDICIVEKTYHLP